MKADDIDLSGVEIPEKWHSHPPPLDGTLFIVRNPAWPMDYIAVGRKGEGYSFTGIALYRDGTPPDARPPESFKTDPTKTEWAELIAHEPATSAIALYIAQGASA